MVMEEAYLRGYFTLPPWAPGFYEGIRYWCNARWIGLSRGLFGGKGDFLSQRHDGKGGHGGDARHSRWGWCSSSPHAPVFTYAALSDRCAAAVASVWQDNVPLEDDMAVSVLRFSLHGGKAAYGGESVHGDKEAA
jgi:hypothetical protein